MSAESLRAAFRRFDRNRDGTIDAEELRQVFQRIGGGFTDSELEQVFRTVDANGDGRIQYAEFVRWLEYGSSTAGGELFEGCTQAARKRVRDSISEEGRVGQEDVQNRMAASRRKGFTTKPSLNMGIRRSSTYRRSSTSMRPATTMSSVSGLSAEEDVDLEGHEQDMTSSNVLKMKMRADCVLLPPDMIKGPVEEQWLHCSRRDRPKGRETQELIRLALRQDPLCALLHVDELDAILATMDFYEFAPGDDLVRQGEVGTAFFVLHQGSLGVTVNGQDVNTICRGGSFGGIALRCKCPRTATISALENSSCWVASGSEFQKVLRENAERQRRENRQLLDLVARYAGLPPAAKDYVAHHFFPQRFEKGACVATQGEAISTAWVVNMGELEASDGSKLVKAEAYGEDAFFTSDSTHRHTITVSQGPCELLCISGDSLKELLGGGAGGNFAERVTVMAALSESHMLGEVPLVQKGALVGTARWRRFDPGKALSDVPAFTVVLEGSLVADPGGRVIDQWLESSGPDDRQVVAAGPDGCKLAMLSRTLVREAVQAVQSGNAELNCAAGDPIRIRAMMKKVPIFKHLSPDQADMLIRSFVLRHYPEGDSVIRQGDVGTAFFVLAAGQVGIIVSGQQVRSLDVNGFFGERALLFDEPRTATVKVISAGGAEIWCLDKATFLHVVQNELQLHFMKERIQLQQTNIQINDLVCLRTIGAGRTGVVSLVEHRETKMHYALKRLKKNESNMQYVERERGIMSGLDHPFIMGFVTTFESSQSLYMLTEYVQGTDLYCLLRRTARALSKEQAQFYAGSLVLALEELHSHGVIHRDLKPENVMVDQTGYVKIIDFGIAKKLADNTSQTYTIVGTPYYTAPEVLIGRGYGLGVDNWSLGVMLYEFLCASLPFGDILEEAADICRAVCKEPLEFPHFFKDKDAARLIVGLLKRKRTTRLGSGHRGLTEIKAAPFFLAGVHGTALFDKIQSRSLEPPFLPDDIEEDGTPTKA